MYGQYKRITNEFTSVLTGKGIPYGGSLARTEATGYGLVYFADNMIRAKGKSFDGAKVVGFRQWQCGVVCCAEGRQPWRYGVGDE